MEAQFVRHVCDLILSVCFLGDDFKRTVLIVVAIHSRPCVACLDETAF
jgi:hypothetical protein